MGLHLFAKTVYDEDLCFIRDLVEVGSAIESVTSIHTMKPILLAIIDKYKLNNKLIEFTENGHYNIKDCYYKDPQKKMSCAKDLLTSCNQIPYIEESEKTKIRYSVLKCLTKWNFSRSEKIQLIKECICPPNSSQVVEEFMVNMYLEIF